MTFSPSPRYTTPEEKACIVQWHCLEVSDVSIAAECAAYILDFQVHLLVHLLVFCHELRPDNLLVSLSRQRDVQC